jgi:integrase
LGSKKGNTDRYVRNVGIKNLYRRGKVYYYLKYGKPISLHTRVRSEARRLLEQLNEQAIGLKFLEKTGLLQVLKNHAQNPESLAPSFVKSRRPDFATFTRGFVARIACSSEDTRRMWRTCNNSLIELLGTIREFNGENFGSLDAWQKFLKLSPTGIWNALKEQGKGPATLNHFAAYLRILVPHLVERGFVPAWFESNLKGLKRLEVHARNPVIPTAEEMETLLSRCEARDWELGQMLRFFAYSGARKGAALGKVTGLIWSRIDFQHRNITLWQKGDQKRTVPMGPQLSQLLARWKARTGGEGEARVFPFGSNKENRAQKILKSVAQELGGSVAGMYHFHAFKHYFKTAHQRQGTPNDISDLLTFNRPAGRAGSGSVYRHGEYDVMRERVERVRL